MLVDGQGSAQVWAMDRGLAYGDGLFESIRFMGEAAPLWSRHMQRLAEGCARLRLPKPDPMQLWDESLAVSHAMAHSVVRITLTRGLGERGYAPPATVRPTRIVAAFAPPVQAANGAPGLRMRVCELRLADQPLLAGMKHLNRLEQVMARAEWDDAGIAEGVLCDSHGQVISATMANLFAVIDGVLITPAVDRCGVAGVARAEVLTVCPQARIGAMPMDALMTASEVILSSSVRGILPVHSLGARIYTPGALTGQLQKHWRNLGFPMEHDG